ncbi:MAG: phenylacetate--CoA ligase family protein, partial [Ignavibacteriaceae bacterium]|nr:phenylacetate--CoA ligase family protein [Ignavibacteriaceae bacterium]
KKKKKKYSNYKFVPKAIMTTGNTLYPETRREIEESFECKVFDSYNCEANPTVFECHTHEGYHSAMEYGITEVLNSRGEEISEGIGTLISTDLWNFAQPFIRYDTQDLVEIDTKSCSCGRKLKRIIRIIGRENDILTAPNGRIFIVHNFTGFFQTDNKFIKKSVLQFQIIYIKNQLIKFLLVVNQNYDEQTEKYIKNFWSQEFNMRVEIELVDAIPLQSNNKRRFIINA